MESDLRFPRATRVAYQLVPPPGPTSSEGYSVSDKSVAASTYWRT